MSVTVSERPYPQAYFVIGGVAYWQSGFFGCQLKSLEWTRKPAGTEREILGVTMRLFSTRRNGLKVEHSWAVPGNGTIDEHRERIESLREDLRKLI